MIINLSNKRININDTYPKYIPLISFVIFAFACLQFMRGEFPLFGVLLFTYMYIDYVNFKKLNQNQTQTKNIIIGISIVKLLIIISLFIQKYF